MSFIQGSHCGVSGTASMLALFPDPQHSCFGKHMTASSFCDCLSMKKDYLCSRRFTLSFGLHSGWHAFVDSVELSVPRAEWRKNG